MYFSEWRQLQRSIEMVNVSSNFIAEGFKKQEFENIIQHFLLFVKKEIRIKNLPNIKFVDDSKFAKRIAAFGQIKDNIIIINIQGRHIMDILRTLAHELVHYHQNQTGKKGSGRTGSTIENQANKLAGRLVRKFGENNSSLFMMSIIEEAKKKKKSDDDEQDQHPKNKTIDIDSDHYPMELS